MDDGGAVTVGWLVLSRPARSAVSRVHPSIGIGRVERERRRGTVMHGLPILRDPRSLVCFVEQAVDLALDALTRHCAAIMSLASQTVNLNLRLLDTNRHDRVGLLPKR